MGIAIKIEATGTIILESVHTPDFDGVNGFVCLSRSAGDTAPIAAFRTLRRDSVPDKHIVLNGRTPREATVLEKTAIDAARVTAGLP